VWVPDQAHEALRDLVRAREAAKKDELRAKHRLSKFLLRHARRAPEGTKAWTTAYWKWLASVRFEHAAQEATLLDYRSEVEHAANRIERLEGEIDKAVEGMPPEHRAVIEALQCLRGVAKIVATTIVTEVGNFSRFTRPKQLMGYGGVVPSEYSSGKNTSRGGITKTGNNHLRRVLLEAAWTYQHRPAMSPRLKKQQQTQGEEIKEISWKAQNRLNSRYWRLLSKGKLPAKAITAVARELLGFIWAIAVPTRVMVTDWNRDGIPDLVAIDWYVHVLLGTGQGGFAPVLDCGLTVCTAQGCGTPPVLADFDGDGNVDLAANNNLWLGMHDCNVTKATAFRAPSDTAFPMAAADLNGDGALDLVVCAYQGALVDGVGYLPGDGHGKLGDIVPLDSLEVEHATCGRSVAFSADFNGDGRLDLVVAGEFSVRVFMNTCQ